MGGVRPYTSGMDETTAILIMMNNYFHDVATAMLIATAAVVWCMLRNLGNEVAPELGHYVSRLYRSMSRLARISLAWIVLGGIPRTIFYRELEWANAAGKGQITALIVKHILVFILVAVGGYVWVRMSQKVARLGGTEQ
jgi:hypothetical protein